MKDRAIYSHVSTLLFATANPHKVAEVQRKLAGRYTLTSLADHGITEELPETSGTIPGNAREKAEYVARTYGLDCFAEDSGLEVDALGGRPGVDTAVYAGTRDDDANMARVLRELGDRPDRAARFRAVIALVRGGVMHTFEGEVAGAIAYAKAGKGGFGYDPIFVPEGYAATFAQLDAAVKTEISHRARAVNALVAFLARA